MFRPSQARIYDVLLGGKDNFECYREAAEMIVAGAPDAPAAAVENRAFLGRAVRYCVDRGVRQFLDVRTARQAPRWAYAGVGRRP